jgi:hypothetical protein
MTAQGIRARAFLMRLPEHMSMLAIFGNELCVTPECRVQNAHETMNELNQSHDSHHSRTIPYIKPAFPWKKRVC